jgi:CRP-like cAMP-binding protein
MPSSGKGCDNRPSRSTDRAVPTDDFDFTKPRGPEPAASTPSSPAPAVPPAAASAPFKPAQSRYYDRKVAEELFRASGRLEGFAAGQALFVEDEKARAGFFSSKSAARMYFLVEGEVTLTVAGKVLDTVKAGEIFGEMAVISERARSASATAKVACTTISLDRAGLTAALAAKPEFALMLMSVMFDRLRFIAARLAARKGPTPAAVPETSVFDAATLAQFEEALPRAATVRHWADSVLMREGQTGAFMYVVKAGRVAITIGGRVVEMIAAGGTFGEMALVDQSPRTATAVTATECELLQVDRPSLLAVVRQQPAFAMAMLRAVTERLRHMTGQLN